MAGIYFQSSEPDLSHFQYLTNIDLVDVGRALGDVAKYNPRKAHLSVLSWALLISLLVHSALLFVNFISSKNQRISNSPQAIHIQLQRKQVIAVQAESVESKLIKPNLVESESVGRVSVEPEISSVTEIVQTDSAKANNPKNIPTENVAAQKIFIPVTPEELSSLQGEPAWPVEPSDADLKEVSKEPFGSVFDPRLRKKLQAQQVASRAKEMGLSSYELSNGSSVVKLSDKHCLSTLPQGRREDATNWYHTKCQEKSESERMMDNVNKALNSQQLRHQ